MQVTIYRMYKKIEQIWNHTQRREAAHSRKFAAHSRCLGTYDVK